MTNKGKSRNLNSGKNGNSSPTNSGGSGNEYKPSKKTLADYIYTISEHQNKQQIIRQRQIILLIIAPKHSILVMILQQL
jgi:hypothetical protein